MISPLLLALVAAGFVAMPCTTQAQLSKIFVASFGNDANDGSRGSPKRNFQAAHNAVAAGGQIVVLDTAGYGALNITKSLAITVPPGVNGFVTVTALSATAITINAGSGATVSLRGLIIEGPGGDFGSSAGVYLTQGTLYLEDCTIRNFGNCGVDVSSIPAGTVAFVIARNVQVRNCNVGFSGVASSGLAGFILTDCAATYCRSVGVAAESGNSSSTFVQMTLTRCNVSANSYGIQSYGPFSTVYVDTCTLSNNQTGLTSSNSGKILTRGNNTFTNNFGGDGNFTGNLPAK